MAKKTVTKKSVVPVPPQMNVPLPSMPVYRRLSWRMALVGLGVILVLLFIMNKGLLMAAVVDGTPIFSWQLNQTLRTRYGQQTLEGMIGEVLIAKEAKKAGVTVTDGEIKEKQKEILSSLGTEVNLEDFLKFQGMTESDFNQQLKIQLTVERLLTKNLTITDADVDNYIATNRATLTATEPAKLREEARQSIVNNTVSEKLQSWFLEIRQNSKVMKFL